MGKLKCWCTSELFQPSTMESGSSSPGNLTTDMNPTRSLHNRFSIASLSSIRTLPPQYSVTNILGEPAGTPSAVNTDNHAPPRYAPSSPNTITSGSTSLQNATEPPRYSLLTAPPSLDLTLTWNTSTATPLEPEVQGDTPEFRYSFPIRQKRPWATLHLHTRDAVPGNPRPSQSQPMVPRIWGCDPITGTLEVDLDSPQIIQQIDISLNGSIIMSSVSEVKFLRHEFTLWDKSMGDPLQSADADANGTQTRKIDGRLAPGKYTFPFSFPFPTHSYESTTLNSSSITPFPPPVFGITQSAIPSPTFPWHEHIPKNGEKNKRMSWTSRLTPSIPFPHHSRIAASLPQSFMEKAVNPSVSYEISVRIVHGRFRASTRIRTDIIYTPALQPLPAPQKRREAYEAGALLPYPMDNPEGWFAYPTPTLYGVINPDANPRHTKADCTFFLAQPLSYTRGSVIPCFLTISSDDEEIVRLLSSPKMPIVRLLRRIRHPMEEHKGAPERAPGDLTTGWMTSNPRPSLPTCEMKLVQHEVGRAQWWVPMKGVAQGPNVRHLEGEIHLGHYLQPSCDFRIFQVEYAVELLSFPTSKFGPEVHPASLGKSRKGRNVLASNPVEIATLYRQDEPIPTAYTEPPKMNIMRGINSEE